MLLARDAATRTSARDALSQIVDKVACEYLGFGVFCAPQALNDRTCGFLVRRWDKSRVAGPGIAKSILLQVS